MSDYIAHDHQHDGIDRKGFLSCMAWAGTGVLWALSGGRVTSTALADALNPTHRVTGTPDFSFVQISDSHIGFHQAANKNVVGTFEEVVRRINALPQRPAFVVHTGDHVHLSRMAEFDTVKQIMTAGAKNLWYAATCAAQLWREKERGDDGDAADTHSHKRPVSPPYSLGSRTSPLRSIR